MISCKENKDLSMEKGIHYYKLSQYSEAMQEFNDVIFEIEQKDFINEPNRKLLARAYYNLGLTYSKIGDYDKSKFNINTAIHLNPLEEYFVALSLVEGNIKN